MLSFDWPEEWNRPFMASLERAIEASIGGQMSKNKTLNFIHGKPSVSELAFGSVAPTLSLKHIHCLTPSRISLSVAFEYKGDASIAFKGVSFNLDTTTVASASGGGAAAGPSAAKNGGGAAHSVASNGASGKGGADGLGSAPGRGPAQGGDAVSLVGDANHSLPFLIPFEISLSSLHLAGSVDIEITQEFVEGPNYYPSSSSSSPPPAPPSGEGCAASSPSASPISPVIGGRKGGDDATFPSTPAADAQQLKKRSRQRRDAVRGGQTKEKKRGGPTVKTLPLSAVVQSLAYTAPSVGAVLTADNKGAVVAEAVSVQANRGRLAPSSTLCNAGGPHAGGMGGERRAMSETRHLSAGLGGSNHQQRLRERDEDPLLMGGRRSVSSGSALPLRPHMLAALQHTILSQQQMGIGMGIGGGGVASGIGMMRSAKTSLTMNNRSYGVAGGGGGPLPNSTVPSTPRALPSAVVAVPMPARGRGGRGGGTMTIVRRPNAEEVRTGVVSRTSNTMQPSAGNNGPPVGGAAVGGVGAPTTPPPPFGAQLYALGGHQQHAFNDNNAAANNRIGLAGGVGMPHHYIHSGVRSHSTDSPTTGLVTPRLGLGGGDGVSHAGGGSAALALTTARHLLQALWQRYQCFWSVPRPMPAGCAGEPSAPFLPHGAVPTPQLKSFLEAYVFKRYARMPKTTVAAGPSADGSSSSKGKQHVVAGGTRVKVLFFTDPLKQFRLQTNFTSIGVDRTLEQLVRTKALKPAIDWLLAEGLSFVV